MLLHFQVTTQNQNINLNRPIHAQEMIFRRAIVTGFAQNLIDPDTDVANPGPGLDQWNNGWNGITGVVNNSGARMGGALGGGVICQPNFMSGLEIVSGDNTSNNDIMISMDESKNVNDRWYDWNFSAEETPMAFTCKTIDFNRENVVFYSDEPLYRDWVAGGREGNVWDDLVDNAIIKPGMIKSIDLFFEFQSLQEFDGF
tara:strand:+ start:231 stop:830 length:600 start_codon:yes stop_codon:yes gene_type:complete